jgi:hypothetical protein
MAVGSTIDLLRSCSWHAERYVKSRGNFNLVLWLIERGGGRRELFELECDAAPDGTSTAAALQE